MMTTLEDILKAAERAGSPYFNPTEMQGFGTRLSEKVYTLRDLDPLQYPPGTLLEAEQATVFVSSERDRHRAENPRLYTVRLALAGTRRRESDGREVPTFDVQKISAFGEYASRSGAHARAKRYVDQSPRAFKPKQEE